MVVVAIVAVIAIALLKPWDDSSVRTAVADKPPAPSVADSVSLVSPSPRQPDDALSRAAVEAALASVPHDPAKAAIVTFWRRDPVSVPYQTVAPRTADLAGNCDTGAMIGSGTDAIGLSLPNVQRPPDIVRLELARLFRDHPSVRLPIAYELDYVNEVALVKASRLAWEPGYYSLTVDVRGRKGTILLCVGNMTRLVDYSLVTYLPRNTDGEAAWASLLGEMAAP